MKEYKIIAVDFDGTVVTHEYPRIGRDVGAVPVLKRLVAAGHVLILNTMRSGKTLTDATEWFRKHEIPLHGVNKNPNQHTWTDSPKVYAHVYIDYAALGCPLTNQNPAPGGLHWRPYVDWKQIERMLEAQGYLEPTSVERGAGDDYPVQYPYTLE